MLLKRIFKPKWQHQDPEVRHQAVATLTPDDADILVRIVREDESPAIRRLALSQLNDLELIHSLAQGDDSDIRQFAHACLLELLSGTRKGAPALSLRMDFLSRHPVTELFESVALNAQEAELRRSAQEHISRETVLGEIAISDAVLANRQAALERITDPSLLESINRQASKRDKHIYRQSRQRLQAIREAQERPARIRAECEQICNDLEAFLANGNLQQEAHGLQRLEARWQAIRDDADPVCQARYAQAKDAYQRALMDFQAAREAQQREWEAALASRQALLAQVAQREAFLLDTQALSMEAGSGYTKELEAWQAAWQEAGELPASLAQPLNEQFHRDASAIRQRLEVLQIHWQREQQLLALLEEAERLQGSQLPVAEQAVKSLERRCKGQSWPTDADRIAQGLQRFEHINRQLRKRVSHQQQQRRLELERLPGRLIELEALLAKQTLKEAAPLHDRIQSSINHLQALGVSREQLRSSLRKLHTMTPRLQELQSWRAWGADEVRQRLCEQMEALIGSEQPPAELASEIRRLRNAWQQLPASGTAGSRSLRKRFDKAASEAYKPCALFFKQQVAERNRNLERKLALLTQLEEFLAAAEWSHMDWHAAVKFQRQISNDWRRAGPVDRSKGRELEARYRNSMGIVNEYLSMERQRNRVQREALIERLRGLLAVEDIHAAIDECKRLQGRWQVTVAGKRQQENTLWQEFRAACDEVFARRKQQHEARHQLENQNRAHKQQLCEQLEGLTNSTLAALDDAERQQQRILDAWQASGPVARHEAPALEKRFEKAQQAFRAHAAMLQEQHAQTQLQQLQQKAAYCRELEQLLEHMDPATALSSLGRQEQQWLDLPPLKDAATEQAMQARFEKVRHALQQGGELRERLLSELAANLNQRKELCLWMEILAGVDSPAEAQQARLELQVKRLAGAMGQGSEDTQDRIAEIRQQWYLTGGGPAGEERILQQRFEKASRAAGGTGT